MATEKQNESSRKSSKKSQPKGRSRKKPGSTGQGEYYHIEVRPKNEFVTFRTQDVGDPGGLQRVAGQRENGSWADVKWLISKEFAHVENGKLVADHEDARGLLKKLGSTPVHIRGDRFEAKPRPNVPESKKPTAAQRKAQQENIKKAQAARKK